MLKATLFLLLGEAFSSVIFSVFKNLEFGFLKILAFLLLFSSTGINCLKSLLKWVEPNCYYFIIFIMFYLLLPFLFITHLLFLFLLFPFLLFLFPFFLTISQENPLFNFFREIYLIYKKKYETMKK
mmetsp:Transcript_16078/g.2243  ORF Transcript_16078/g.2243 Transcript_16078/m.2243 type:complete len:126 (+) Transcript_16078:171-548(+)